MDPQYLMANPMCNSLFEFRNAGARICTILLPFGFFPPFFIIFFSPFFLFVSFPSFFSHLSSYVTHGPSELLRVFHNVQVSQTCWHVERVFRY